MIENYFNIPTIVLRGMVVFPEMIIHFDVGRDKSIKALNKAMEGDRKVFLALQKDITDDNPNQKGILNIGCLATIKQVLKVPGENTIKALVEGVSRAKINSFVFDEPYFSVDIDTCNDIIPRMSLIKKEAILRKIKDVFDEYAQVSQRMSSDIISHVIADDELGHLVDYITANLPLQWNDKQDVLECLNVVKRSELLFKILTKECEILSIDNEIHFKVQSAVEENQREYFLREQLKVINSELGLDNEEKEADVYKNKINKLNCSEEIKAKLLKEVLKLENQPYGSHESSVIRAYIDCCLEFPFGVYTKDKINLKTARNILEKEHYGLEKVKQRIIEMLAVRKLTDQNNGSILCLIGAPGVGKTSIASSVAKCMGRNFARISLGGIKDESEIRGHRRTYVGSMPGRIISAFIDSKSSNPVILLDEIDKIGSDFKGDCSAALLEALDPEQNSSFKDHYLDLPIDLSKALFITTANDASSIPAPLFDRMEVIEISSYTSYEKLMIAKKHLVKKQMKLNGINSDILKISDSAIECIIENYTREGGVRNLERKLAALCRKAAVQYIDDGNKVVINDSNIEKYLGSKKYKTDNVCDKKDEVGLVNGLAWTSVGGEIMEIETVVLDGTGKVVLTGSLGDVMQESAKNAISFIRSVAKKYGIDSDFYKTKDIHINAVETAVPKDGPSAGITMTVSLLSALTGCTVRRDVAMTGEITLRGKVLPIGGLKEKTMAAYKAGVKTVLVPIDNKPDIDEVEQVVKDNVKFIYVDDVEKIIPLVINLNSNDNENKFYSVSTETIKNSNQRVRI